jgi:hypothetical protein
MPFGTTVKGLFVWDFEFVLLGFVCDLVFGACDFYNFH